MHVNVYHVLHVGGAILMTAYVFRAFAAPPQTRKATLAISGTLSLIVAIAGFALLGKLGLEFPGWAIVKIGCWLGLAALAGLGYRLPSMRSLLSLIAAALVLIAVYMVYYRPFP
jgi:hypothetical protein